MKSIEKQRKKAEKEITKLQRLKDSMKNEKVDGAVPIKMQKTRKQKDKRKFYMFNAKSRRRFKKKRDEAYLITIWFANGTSITDILTTNQKTFTFKKKTYYLYHEECYFDLRMGMYHFYYFENYPVPINREVEVKDKTDPYSLVDTSSLGDLLKGEYIKVLAGSHNFSKLLKGILVFSVINTAISLIIAFMMYNAGK